MEQVLDIPAPGRIPPARPQPQTRRERHHRRVAVHAFVHGRDENHRELQPLGGVYTHHLHRVGGVLRRGILPRAVDLTQHFQIPQEGVERSARRRGPRLRQELVDIGRRPAANFRRVPGFVHGVQQQQVEPHVLAPPPPLPQAAAEAEQRIQVLRVELRIVFRTQARQGVGQVPTRQPQPQQSLV